MQTHTNARVTFVTPSHAIALANAIYSLDEPWRTRFIDLISKRVPATMTTTPSPEEIAGWLQNRVLYRDMRTLFRAWTHQ
jgi:hypothetical protein